MEDVARPDEGPKDIDALLAEVERTLGGPSAGAKRGVVPARTFDDKPSGEVEQPRGGLVARVRFATITAAVAAAGVWVIFAVLPFWGAASGASGAFLSVFLVALVLGRRR